MASRKQNIERLRNLFDPMKYRSQDRHEFLKELYEGLRDNDLIDMDYFKHIGKGKENLLNKLNRVSEFTLEECKTALTYILRAEHWVGNSFEPNIKNRNVYNILTRMCELLDE